MTNIFKTKRTLILSTLLTGVGVIAIASTASARPDMLTKIDTNKDGQIQYSEFLSHGNQRFEQMDADGNGFVTKEERQAFRKQKQAKRAQMRFAKTDTNGDGFISKSEYTVAQDARAAKREEHRANRMDANHDGQIDQADTDLHHKKHKARKAKHKNKHAKHNGKQGMRAKPDTNGDGMLSLAEHQIAGQAMFDRIDADNNGVLDTQELANMRKHHKRGKRGAKHGGMR